MEVVPTYRDLCICYDPLEITVAELREECDHTLSTIGCEMERPRRVVEVPVAYGANISSTLRRLGNANKTKARARGFKCSLDAAPGRPGAPHGSPRIRGKYLVR